MIVELRAGVDEDGCRLAVVATGCVATFFTVNGQPRFAGIAGPPGLREARPAMSSGEPVAADVAFYVMSVTEAVAARFLGGPWATRPDLTSLRVERGHRRTDGTEVFGFEDGVRCVACSQRPRVVLVDRGRLLGAGRVENAEARLARSAMASAPVSSSTRLRTATRRSLGFR